MSPEISFFSDLISLVTASTAFSMPRFSAIGFAPAATAFTPSRKIDWARIVAVVVPSPATSEVFDATSRTICAPMFSCGFSSSISLATVTPSLVMVGPPNFFSRTTLRPRGPSVTLTASASWLTPRRIACRESSLYVICFAMNIFSLCRVIDNLLTCLDGRNKNTENVVFPHDHVFRAFHLGFAAGVFGEKDAVADFDIEGDEAAILDSLSVTDGDDLTFLWFLLGRVGNHNSIPRGFLLVNPLHHDAVVQRSNVHTSPIF